MNNMKKNYFWYRCFIQRKRQWEKPDNSGTGWGH